MVINNFKHLTKVYALGLLLSSGCVLREPVFKEFSHVDHNADGTCSTNTVRCCVGNHEEFSTLGVTWNTASYGI